MPSSDQHFSENAAHQDNIFLVGLMGAGKTSVGRMLAQRLDMTFFDADAEIERITGVKIPVIFEIEGESGFRSREEKMIEQLTAMNGIPSIWNLLRMTLSKSVKKILDYVP